MRKLTTAAVFLLLLAGLSASAQDSTSTDEQSLGDVARQTRQEVKDRDAQAAQGKVPPRKVIEMSSAAEANNGVRDLVTKNAPQQQGAKPNTWSGDDLKQLQAAADRARLDRRRLPGGIWQLHEFYDIVTNPPGGTQAPEWQWQALVGRLEQWTKMMPDSYSAKIALAQAHLNWGWKERGSGYADSVSDGGWKALDAHANAAMALIKDPQVLNSDDPYRYEVLMQLGLIAGSDKATMQRIFERAISQEPDYYHYYRLYANYLQEKWYGAPGEVQAFAQTSANRVGGQQGDFIYFEIASLIACNCDMTGAKLAGMSWPRIKSGYEAMENLYGTSMLKRNRMAMMASQAGDVAMAQKMFQEIGESWDPAVWHSQAIFVRAKAAALAGQSSRPGVTNLQGK